MSTIMMSPGLVINQLYSSLWYSDANTVRGRSTYLSPNNYSTYIWVYKGTIPSGAETEFNNTTTVNNLRSTDRLLKFFVSANSPAGWQSSVASGVPKLIFNYSPVPTATAERDGTASWFMMFGHFYNFGHTDTPPSSLTTSVTALQIGTISGPEGGGDLVLQNPNLTTGQIVQLGVIEFSFPTTYTY